MSRITLDHELRSKLNGLGEQVEVCDEAGKTVGQFVPQDWYMELMYAWAKQQFSDEKELEQARAEVRAQGGYTTAEAIAYLERIAREAKGGP